MPKPIKVKTNLEANGLSVVVNGRRLSLKYPKEIWRTYPESLKIAFRDNIALSSTFFAPQILNNPRIEYETSRPVAEAFLFKNGLYDMAGSALADGKSSTEYLKNFINTTVGFRDDSIRLPKPARREGDEKEIVIPFTFGKESLLSLAVAKEIGMKPRLVYYVEPTHLFEHKHKQPLIRAFKELGLPVYEVGNGPGMVRYGRLWGKQTELGWGLQTTEYALLSLPLVDYWNAKYVAFGNEQSCGETGVDAEGNLVHWTAYDQHPDWTSQQGLLMSLLAGRKVDVVSLVSPLHEFAEIAVLHRRYPNLAKYQMSCLAQNKAARHNRWCQNCEKCGVMYAFLKALDMDVRAVGFTENLLDRRHVDLFDKLFTNSPDRLYYGMEEEMLLTLYILMKRGIEGEVISRFRRTFPKFKAKEHFDEYLKVYPSRSMPKAIQNKVIAIYKEELGKVRRELSKFL